MIIMKMIAQVILGLIILVVGFGIITFFSDDKSRFMRITSKIAGVLIILLGYVIIGHLVLKLTLEFLN